MTTRTTLPSVPSVKRLNSCMFYSPLAGCSAFLKSQNKKAHPPWDTLSCRWRAASRRAPSIYHLVDGVFQRLARLEAGCLGGSDLDGLAGLRVAASASGAFLHG